MNINYSINNSVLMMMSEFMITAFVIVILFVIVLVYNKAFKSELSIKIFCFSQLTAIFISVLEITTKRTKKAITRTTVIRLQNLLQSVNSMNCQQNLSIQMV